MNKLIQNLKKKLKAISVAGFEGINAAEPDSDNEQLVNVELSRLLAWRILVSSRSSFLGYFTLAYLLKNSVSRYALCIWVGLLVCMELFNVVVQLKFLRVLNDRSRRTEWLAFYPIPLFMTGVLWGIVGVLPGVMSDPWMFMLTLLFLIAVSIFSVHNLCFYRKMLSAFTVGLAVPVMVNGLLNPSSFQLMICFAACIFLVMIHIYGLTIRDLYLHDIRSRLLAQKMAAQIKKSNEELSQALIKVSELATRDSLTGCLNRRSLLEILDHEVERISRTRQCVGIIMFDLDHFKLVNDTYGHNVGDEILVGTSELVKKKLRPYDKLARWGGEEFLCVLPNIDNKTLLKKAQEFCDVLATSHLSRSQHDLIVTASFGIALIDPDKSVQESINLADQALYRSKQAGRNQVSE